MVGWTRRNTEARNRNAQYLAWTEALSPEERDREKARRALAEEAALGVSYVGLCLLALSIGFLFLVHAWAPASGSEPVPAPVLAPALPREDGPTAKGERGRTGSLPASRVLP